jgi:hypothetical protein
MNCAEVLTQIEVYLIVHCTNTSQVHSLTQVGVCVLAQYEPMKHHHSQGEHTHVSHFEILLSSLSSLASVPSQPWVCFLLLHATWCSLECFIYLFILSFILF